eukprot:gnl/TRDRNA2_/TRDRNA2_177288_c2_seq6.p1 gnl/TRDRNA2_/TRDRNA2_177288_c2~~gnl/TRDRNA2_/TRDRNA2_177288_c2_seq6.p1  ORF type:complete len:230 (-),score=14.57 gnl/TRDRNA2_/TRDRNA2_177288_c2_seq6:144-833(-)
MAEFSTQDLSNTAWAMAVQNFGNCPFLDAIAAASIPSISSSHVRSLANIAWSVSALEFSNRPLLDAIASSARPRLPQFTPQNMVNLAWSMATCIFHHQPCLEALSASALAMLQASDTNMDRYTNPNVARWSATAEHRQHETAGIGGEVTKDCTHMSMLELTMMAWHPKRLAIGGGLVLHAALSADVDCLRETNPSYGAHDLANSVWSLYLRSWLSLARGPVVSRTDPGA